MHKISLKISLSPRDLQILTHMLPHQLRFWHDAVDEVLLVFDLHGYNTTDDQSTIESIYLLVEKLVPLHPKIRIIEVDYSLIAQREISIAYFGGKAIPPKTHRYGPYYAYFYGIYHTSYDFVLNTDCDMFFGGKHSLWLEEAINLLNKKDIVTCSPLPGPPRKDGKLIRQAGQRDKSNLGKIFFDSISTRIFFIHKPTFKENIFPLPIKLAEPSLAIRALVRKRPIYELPEDTISWIMKKKQLKRVDFLGTKEGVWTLHPPYRNNEFYAKLPEIIKRIENNDIPAEQRGDYDLNASMVDWSDAKEQIRANSLRNRFWRVFKV